MQENNSELWNLFPELLNCLIFIFIFILFFLHTFCVELFSGQDEVRTSNLLHLSVGLSAIRSHAPTTQPSLRLKVDQLLIIRHDSNSSHALFYLNFLMFRNKETSAKTRRAPMGPNVRRVSTGDIWPKVRGVGKVS